MGEAVAIVGADETATDGATLETYTAFDAFG